MILGSFALCFAWRVLIKLCRQNVKDADTYLSPPYLTSLGSAPVMNCHYRKPWCVYPYVTGASLLLNFQNTFTIGVNFKNSHEVIC